MADKNVLFSLIPSKTRNKQPSPNKLKITKLKINDDASK